ncbi:hypothetical protein LSH36_506g02050 [Paralvinella palmiformis]|uniref:Cytochrome c oxidase subunit 4 n=1 Tax=Paralvinella palmiformis TaxID=53620 RepID=A0AAD9J8V7_9ANNE|nr:hypothetical protein LSH36_506g02050 [Paralvinella palmiformis]
MNEMANHLVKHMVRVAPRMSVRCASSSTPARPIKSDPVAIPEELPQELKDSIYPKIGKREIVGFGWNGLPTYVDRCEFPFPSIRFKETTPEILALREKEKGDWKKLSVEEKKALYRSSFCQTFAEFDDAPTGEWKSIIGLALMGIVVTGWCLIAVHQMAYDRLPVTITEEWKEKMVEHMVRQGQNPLQGVSSIWDYENNRWKK